MPPDRKGLINGHAYSVLDLQTVAPDVTSGEYFRMVKIRNPHGQGEWQGAWSDRSPLWEKHPRRSAGSLGSKVARREAQDPGW